MTRLLNALTLALTVLLAGFARAEQPPISEEQKAAFEQRLAAARERLQLTPEQEAAIEPILRESAEQRRAVFAQHGMDGSGRSEDGQRPSFRELRALRNDMEVVREQTRDELAEVLTDDQLDTWDDMSEEFRAEMRDRIRSQ